MARNDPPRTYRLNTSVAPSLDEPWWHACNKTTLAGDMVATAERLEADQTWLEAQRLIWAKLFTEQNASTIYRIGGSSNIAADVLYGPIGRRVSWNGVQICCNTVMAKLSKNRPRVRFMTSGGSHKQQRRAIGLTKFCDGLFEKTGLWDKLGPIVFRDATVWGTGGVEIGVDDGEIVVERCIPDEFYFDLNDAMYGATQTPRTVYKRAYKSKDWLREKFGGNSDEIDLAIESASTEDPGVHRPIQGTQDMVKVWTAWHLPDGRAKPGAKVTAIGTTLLSEKTWDKDYFPQVWLHWEAPLMGVWGTGIPERLVGMQIEMHRLNRQIQDTHKRAAVVRIFTDSNQVYEMLTNDNVAVYKVDPGTNVHMDRGTGAHESLYRERDQLLEMMFKAIGVSEMSAVAQKPAGLNSEPSLREFHDIESERFVLQGQRYENFFVEIAKRFVDLGADLYTDKKDVSVLVPSGGVVEEIKWSEVNLERDAYVMQAFPTSTLPLTPAARFKTLQEWRAEGIISRDEMMLMLDMPDLEKMTSLHKAATELIQHRLDAITDAGKYEPPGPLMDLGLAIKMGSHAAMRAEIDGVEPARIDMLYRFVAQAQEMLGGQPQEAPPGPGAVAPDPGMAAAGPPVPMAPASPAAPGEIPALPSHLPGIPVP